jgi:hypothetical protein
LEKLGVQIKQLRQRDELTEDLDGEPTMPAPAGLAEIVAHIDQVIDRQQPARTKTLIESLVAEVKIIGPNQVVPIFRVPQPRPADTGTAGATVTALPTGQPGQTPVRTMGEVVALLQALANPSSQVRRLFELAESWPGSLHVGEAGASPTCRVARQLRPDEVDELVVTYEAGGTVYKLATQFGIHRKTVGKHLRARGIDTTPPGLHPDDVPEAVELYRSGWSLAKIAKKFGTSNNPVRRCLVDAGVVMRARGWPVGFS